MKKVLFVCSANKDRSRTAEDYFSEKYPTLRFDSAGTNEKICFQLGTQVITEELLQWADEIYVMETKHKKIIETFSKEKYKINVLYIPDRFAYGNNELIALLDDKLKF